MSKQLIVRNDASLSVSISDEAEKLKDKALELSSLIGRVADGPPAIARHKDTRKRLRQRLSGQRQCGGKSTRST
jgi:hypothetical protein